MSNLAIRSNTSECLHIPHSTLFSSFPGLERLLSVNLLRILIIVLLITPLEKKETVISMNKDWSRIRDVYDYDPMTKSWEPTGIKLDMDEYEECPNCFVILFCKKK